MSPPRVGRLLFLVALTIAVSPASVSYGLGVAALAVAGLMLGAARR